MSKRFRDPIHGFIEVSDDELKIIDTIEFQRMRNIKQLATTYLIYHGAEHSRFGHSLGMMHLVTRAFNSALDNYKKQNKKDLFDNDTRQVYLQILRLIALLHDIGHAPFSHACEDAFEKGIVHEDFTREIILNTGIRELINNIGEKYKEEYKNCETIITADLLWLIYGEKDEIAVKSLDYKFQDFKFLKCFTNSDVDCDKMDYLLRDSHYCGVNYGKYDINRLLSCLSVYTNNEGIKQLALKKSGLQSLEEFVLARYFMFIQVYFHKTRRFLDKQFSMCMKEIFKDNPLKISDLKDFLNHDDTTVWNKIKEISDSFRPAKNLINRNIYTCVFQSNSFKTDDGLKLFNAAEKELKDGDISDNDYLLDKVEKYPHHFPTINNYDDESGNGIPILSQNNEPGNLTSVSPIIKNLTELIIFHRIYVDKSHTKLIKKIKEKYNS